MVTEEVRYINGKRVVSWHTSPQEEVRQRVGKAFAEVEQKKLEAKKAIALLHLMDTNHND